MMMHAHKRINGNGQHSFVCAMLYGVEQTTTDAHSRKIPHIIFANIFPLS